MIKLLIKLWDSISERNRTIILPIVLSIIIIFFLFNMLLLFRNNEKALEVLKSEIFHIMVITVLFSVVAIYLNRILKGRNKRKLIIINSILIFIFFVILALILLNFSSDSIHLTVHIYPFETQNYNINMLSFLLRSLNQESYTFIIHEERYLPEYVKYSKRPENYVYFEILNEIHKSSKDKAPNDIAIAIVPIRLKENLFSVTWSGYAVLSTVDWDSEFYKPLTIYEYLIFEFISLPLISASFHFENPIRFHKSSVTIGCIWDFKKNKSFMRETLIKPRICKVHEELIVRYFGQNVLGDMKEIISFDWLYDNKMRKQIKSLYNFDFQRNGDMH